MDRKSFEKKLRLDLDDEFLSINKNMQKIVELSAVVLSFETNKLVFKIF